MRIESIRALPGPNVYADQPVLRARIDPGGLPALRIDEVPGLAERLPARVPGLAERPRGEAPLAHAVERVALALSQALGVGGPFARTARAGAPGRYDVVLEYRNEPAARFLLEAAAELVEAVARGRLFALEERLGQARRVAAEAELPATTRAIVQAAARRGVPVSRVDEPGLVQLGQGRHRRRLRGAQSDGTSAVAAAVAADWGAARRLLRQAELPVPRCAVARSAAEAAEALDDLRPPLAVRPPDGAALAGLSTAEELERAYELTAPAGGPVTVEEVFEGRRYRAVVVGGRLAGAVEAPPPHLACEGARDVTAEAHPEVARLCERAARVLGLDVCGLELVLPDVSRPVPRAGAGVVSATPEPDLRAHRGAAAAVVEMLFPGGGDGRVPTVAITGTNGKTTTRMIGHALEAAGRVVGMTTTEGVWIGGHRVAWGDTTGPQSARVVLSDPLVEAAVLETARGGILRRGLGYDWADVGVLTNVQPDHLGQDGIATIDELLAVKAVVARRVRAGGTLVLNADDERLAGLPGRLVPGDGARRVVYFSLRPDSPVVRRHRAAGGAACVLDGGWLVEAVGGREHRVARAAALPVTLGGAAKFQAANALAALAACRALGVGREAFAVALAGFRGNEHNQGRMNVYRTRRGHLILDYGHNPGAFEALAGLTAALGGRRRTGVICGVGDRDDAVIAETGRAAARAFDRLIIREDEDRRGRRVGEIAELVRRAAEEEAPGKECRVILDEGEALRAALEEMEEGEVVLFIYDKHHEPTPELARRFGARPVEALGGAGDAVGWRAAVSAGPAG